MKINEISKRINKINHEKGFWDKGVDVPQKLMLIVSEVSEAMEADRNGKTGKVGLIFQDTGEMGTEVFEKWFTENIKDTYSDELADIAIRLFDLAEEQGIDLESHISWKVRYNEGRPKMHGGKKY